MTAATPPSVIYKPGRWRLRTLIRALFELGYDGMSPRRARQANSALVWQRQVMNSMWDFMAKPDEERSALLQERRARRAHEESQTTELQAPSGRNQ